MTRFTRQHVINAKSWNCNFDDQATGTLHDQINKYPLSQPPFFEYRPVTTVTLKLRQEAKVKAMSPEAKVKYRAKQESARMRLSTGKKQQENEIPEAE